MSLSLLANILALLFSFFVVGALFGALFSKPFRKRLVEVLHLQRLLLAKSDRNPILAPGKNPWTAEAVMNPAAVVLANRTHLIYRAVGMDGVSRLGYAGSADGVVFDAQLPYPVYVAQNPRNLPDHMRRYSPILYPSGGSWGGCEDPRAVALEDRVYITFNMFDGWDFIRVAAISIAQDDFIAHRFGEWKGPHILSRPGEIHKNWVLFPEKINGRFAILHSIAPEIEIAYRDSIEGIGTEESFIESWVGARGGLPARENTWDSFIRSAGPPPVKTDRGWLLLYHAIDEHDPGRYKLGALLLDLSDPTKVLHRAALPILSPDEHYENNGKPGIVYACGAVVRDGTLFVYYGGADRVVCVATAPLGSFLDALIEGGNPSLESRSAQTV
ncbi:hypothetical protein KGQ25_00915 [Patescibacteria group bacterium]|nr:hypothetical protein [Patescibacteria group bacterium]